ncbi:MAG: leucine-rich repeat protein [Clostridia bacterium]|nr:leucine-rich repeat protein [Clostridia bacterium]
MRNRIFFSAVLFLLAFCLIFSSCAKKDEPQKAPDDQKTEEPANTTEEPASTGLAFVPYGNGTCYLYGLGTCTDVEIVVPAISPLGDRVVAIGDGLMEDEESCSGFFGCNEIKSVVVPEGVTSIGEGAFVGCTSMERIELPNSLTKIGDCAFYGCTLLTEIVIPDNVTTVGVLAFDSCTSMRSASLSKKMTSIAAGMFQRCNMLRNVTIPESVKTIEQYAFAGCNYLESIDIPDSVTSIEQYAFANCASLESIVIPDSITSLETYTFASCSFLSGITLPKTLTSIGEKVFADCDSLTEMTYLGTVDEWNKITKAEKWDAATEKYLVHCLDGDYEKPLVEVIVPVADGLYTPVNKSSDYVKLNVSFTDANGDARTGDIVIQLCPDCAPLTVANFKNLVSEGYYDGTDFFRIIEGCMIQGGENEGMEADYIKGEFEANGVENPLSHVRGTISMARRAVDYDGVSAYDSASAGFFIMQEDYTAWDGQYAAFGTVVFGIENVDHIATTDLAYSYVYQATVTPKHPVTINSITFVAPVK